MKFSDVSKQLDNEKENQYQQTAARQGNETNQKLSTDKQVTDKRKLDEHTKDVIITRMNI